jgi:hypothetical protein
MILTIYALAFAMLAALAAWCAATRWWHYAVLAVAWLPLFPWIASHLMGDVSRYLPASTFSEGSDGKDEIVLASAYGSVMLAFIAAALAWWAIRVGWRLLRRPADGGM